MEKTVIELFAGVGGFRCGLNNVSLINDKVSEQNNWKFVWANQWEPATKSQEAYDCYVKRFGNKDTSNIDIFEVDKSTIPNHSLLVGGFPCQDYSVARTLSGSKGIEGKKGVLWWAIIDTIKAKHTPFLFLENVDRLLISPASQRGRDFAIILKSLSDLGYGVEWRIINAADYGYAQKRRRTYIVAFHKSTKYFKKLTKNSFDNIITKTGIFTKQFPIQNTLDINEINLNEYQDLIDITNNFKNQFFNSGVMLNGYVYTIKTEAKKVEPIPLKNIRETDIVDVKYFLSDEKLEKFKYLKGSKKIPRTKPNGENYWYSEGSMPFPDNLDAPARTMLTSESSLSRTTHVINDYKTDKLRLLTPLECERINGFPDNWTNTGMSDKKRYFMMGNALVVGVIKQIGEELDKIIENE